MGIGKSHDLEIEMSVISITSEKKIKSTRINGRDNIERKMTKQEVEEFLRGLNESKHAINKG